MKPNRQKVNQMFARAFEESFSDTSFEKENINESSFEQNEIMKTARCGLPIYNATLEGITDFLRNYMESELYSAVATSAVENTLPIDITFGEFSYDNRPINKSGDKHIKDATGIIGIRVGSKTIEVPFVISDSELEPFEMIQLEKQRVPYTSAGIRKVTSVAVDKMKQEETGEVESSYLGTAPISTQNSHFGFLGDVLNIRNLAMHGQFGSYRAAGEMDDLLEKIASLKPYTDQEFSSINKLRSSVSKIKSDNELEKIASEMPKNSRDDEIMYKRAQAMSTKYVDAKSLPDGTGVIVSIMKKSKAGKLTGMVIKNFSGGSDAARLEGRPPVNIILLENNKIIPLREEETVLVEKAPVDKVFNVYTCRLGSMKDKTMFFPVAPMKDKKLFILNSSSMWRPGRMDGYESKADQNYDRAIRRYHIHEILGYGALYKKFAQSIGESLMSCRSFDIYEVKKAIFGQYDVNTLRKMVAKTLGVKMSNFSSADVIHSDNYAADRDQKVIPIFGICYGYPTDRKQLDTIVKYAGSLEQDFEKLAASQGYIDIVCLDRREGLYNVNVRYTDKSKRMFRRMNQDFTGITEPKVRAILSILKVPSHDASVAIVQSKNSVGYKLNIPEDVEAEDFKKLQGGVATNLTKDKLKNTIKTFVDPGALATTFATAAGAKLLFDTLHHYDLKKDSKVIRSYKDHIIKRSQKENAGIGPDGYYSGDARVIRNFEQMEKNNSEIASFLSAEFEKLAASHESEALLEIARNLAISAHFSNKLSEIASGEVFFDLDKVATEIVNSKPNFEKSASELWNLKASIKKSGDKPIEPHYVTAALESLDNLYEKASYIDSCLRDK